MCLPYLNFSDLLPETHLFFLFGESKHSVLTHNLDPLGHSWVGSKGHPQSCLTLIGDNIPEIIFSKKFILEKISAQACNDFLHVNHSFKSADRIWYIYPIGMIMSLTVHLQSCQ